MWVALVLLVVVLTVNFIAWRQAWAMTHYTPAGTRTPKPEELSFGEKVATIFTGVSVPRPQNEHTPADVNLQYTTRSIPAGQHGGTIEAWYVPSQSASNGLILMFTGYAESKDTLLTQATALHRMGYDALMVDFRGAGGSSGDDTTLGVRESEDVAVAFNYARKEWPNRPVVLYGVSMGGAAVLRAIALGGVKPDGVILESVFDRLVSTVGNRFNAMGLPAFPMSELLVFWGSIEIGSNGFENNPVEYARSVNCPSLVLHGERDPRVTVAQSNSVYTALGGYKEQAEFAGAQHESLAVFAPQRWTDTVETFLRHVPSR